MNFRVLDWNTKIQGCIQIEPHPQSSLLTDFNFSILYQFEKWASGLTFHWRLPLSHYWPKFYKKITKKKKNDKNVYLIFFWLKMFIFSNDPNSWIRMVWARNWSYDNGHAILQCLQYAISLLLLILFLLSFVMIV